METFWMNLSESVHSSWPPAHDVPALRHTHARTSNFHDNTSQIGDKREPKWKGMSSK